MRHFYVHDGGVTIVAADGKVHEYPVDVLKAFASKFLSDWSEKSGEGLEALRKARAASGSFPAIPSCQRFARVLDAANGMADTTMQGLQEDLEFYAVNLDDCARVMEEIDMDAAEVLEMMESIARRGDAGLVVDSSMADGQREAAAAVGGQVIDARHETEAAAFEQAEERPDAGDGSTYNVAPAGDASG